MIARLDTTRLSDSARVQADKLDTQIRRVQAALSGLAGAVPAPTDKGWEHTHTAALVAAQARELMDVAGKLFEASSALNVLGRISEETLPDAVLELVKAAPQSRKKPKRRASRGR